MFGIRYVLALDIGIASIGWAVLLLDGKGEPIKIVDLGVRVFDPAEVPKTGASTAAARRAARGARRVTRCRRHRKERIRHLIDRSGMMPWNEQTVLFEKSGEQSIYEIRVEALDRLLTKEEAVRLLIHLAQRRGYKSNSRSEEAKEKENGKVKGAIDENKKHMESMGYRTVGEMYWKDERFKRTEPDGRTILCVHNTTGDYKTSVSRELLREELCLIFASQRALGAEWATEEFEAAYLGIWGSQRNFDEGPGGNSPYGGAQIEKMLGKCTFEEELRAPKACYTTEYFQLLQTVNHMRLFDMTGAETALTEEQRETVKQLALKSDNVNYTKIRKALGLPETLRFKGVRYGKQTLEKAEKKSLGLMRFYHQLRKALDKVERNGITKLDDRMRDEIGRIVTLYKGDAKRLEELEAAQIPERFRNAILELSATKAGHLSLEAMRKLIPHLEEGLTYDKACVAVYDRHDGKKETERTTKLCLGMAEEIRNPVVRRAVSQTIKVVNAVVRTYGPPETVRVELARELGKPFEVRRDITKEQQKNRERNESDLEKIREIKQAEPNGMDLVKYRLYEEQNGVCLYSGQNLELERLFERGYAEVDHIIPYSCSLDDKFTNKVVVLTAENRQKGNRTPYGYFGTDSDRWTAFEARVNTGIRNLTKRRNLLTQQPLTEERVSEFKARNLKDTQYLSKVIFHLIDDHLLFSEYSDRKRRTESVAGAITAMVRKRLGIEKIRGNGDLHHARDAAVIGCITPGLIHRITTYAKGREMTKTREGFVDQETGELLTREEFDAKYLPKFPAPWQGFREELEARLSEDPNARIAELKLTTYDDEELLKPVFVSRMPKRKITGQAHKETIRSGREKNCTVSKVGLVKLQLNQDGEIEGYYEQAKKDDALLYEALKIRLAEFEGNGAKAFAEPFYKPKRDGTNGPLVKTVKILEKATDTVQVGNGVAGNGEMIRVDVFRLEDGYYFVPIYIADTVKKELPNKAVIRGKSSDEWQTMNEEDFVFSLYKRDLIYIERGKPIVMNRSKTHNGVEQKLISKGMVYFEGFSISVGSIKVKLHDGSYEQPSLLGKSIDIIEKYEVDVLGNYTKVHLPEKRMRFK